MQARLDRIVVAQQTTSSQILGWSFLPIFCEAPSEASVTILKSYVENDGFEEIDTVYAEQGWYLDTGVDRSDRWEQAYYKLLLTVDGESTEYGPVHLNSKPDKISLGMIRHMNTYLRQSGEPVLVYQFLNSGERCRCFDPVLQKTTTSMCENCFNTGYVTGYYTPVLTLATVGIEGKTNDAGARKSQDAHVEMQFSSYPILRPEDIIYLVDNGKRYRIQHITTAEKHKFLINQSISTVALKPTDVEHDLPIPDLTLVEPIISRKKAVHRLAPITDGETFDERPFKIIPY